MTSHPNRSTQARLLAQGCDIARAILADGPLTLIEGDDRHNGGVVARQRAALLAVEHACRVYNAADYSNAEAAFIDADVLRQTLRDGAIALAARDARPENRR